MEIKITWTFVWAFIGSIIGIIIGLAIGYSSADKSIKESMLLLQEYQLKEQLSELKMRIGDE